MKYRNLGRTQVSVSQIGFGAWALGGGWGPQADSDSLAALNTAIDRGVNLLDTAAGYGNGRSEKIIAAALKLRREQIFVATKTPPLPGVWPPSPYCRVEDRYPDAYLRSNLDERRKLLETDCIDLLQLHTWTRAWNANPRPLDTLKQLQSEGKLRYIGISTPEQDQNCVIELMRRGYLDTIQVIFNIFEQEAAAEIFSVAQECNVGVIVRVALDEGALTGKYRRGQRFAEDDFRSRYFQGDRIDRVVERVERIQADLAQLLPEAPSLAEVALRFALAQPSVSTVIPGMRNAVQAEANSQAGDLEPLRDEVVQCLRGHAWRRGVWYGGK
ncbi:MAG TPA: aldo/keto reductase [Pirellulales bacterium]|nr:aldo/keto reductase [Pirellulales bacterium]